MQDEREQLRMTLSASDSEDGDSSFPNSGIIPAQRPWIQGHVSEMTLTPALKLKLQVDALPGCGGVAWPAGEVLARYLASRNTFSAGGGGGGGPTWLSNKKSVVELGSGTGLVGLVAAKLGAPNVVITDQLPLLDIMTRNVHLNDLSSAVSVLELNWGAPLPPGLPQPDLVLAADCVYFEPAFELLVKTLTDLVPLPSNGQVGEAIEVLFCYKKRRKADKRFFTALKKHFDWVQVDDDPDYEDYRRQAISLLRLVRKK